MTLLGNHTVGVLFIPRNLTGELCLNMLEDSIDLLITKVMKNDQNHNVNRQHTALAHYVVAVREFLNNQFSGP